MLTNSIIIYGSPTNGYNIASFLQIFRFVSDDLKLKQHELLKRAFMNDGGESPASIIRRTAAPQPPALNEQMRVVYDVLNQVKETPAFLMIFSPVPDTKSKIEYEIAQLSMLDSLIMSKYGLKEDDVNVRIEFLLDAIRAKVAALNIGLSEQDRKLRAGGGKKTGGITMAQPAAKK